MKTKVLIAILILTSMVSFSQKPTQDQSLKDLQIGEIDQNKGYIFIAAQTWGGKIGYMKNFGASLSIGSDFYRTNLSFILGAPIKLVREQKVQWNVSPLLGALRGLYSLENNKEWALAYGIGTDFSYRGLYINFDLFFDKGKYNHVMCGIGYRFKLK
jgi:hypothetical protein